MYSKLNGYCKCTFHSKEKTDHCHYNNQEGLFEDSVFKKSKVGIKNYNPNIEICSKKMDLDSYIIKDNSYEKICKFWEK